MTSPPPNVKASVLRAIQANRSPTRRQALRRRFAAYWVVTTALLVTALGAGFPRVSWALGASLLACAASSWWLLCTSRSSLGHPRPSLLLSSCFVPVILAGGALAGSRVLVAPDTPLSAHFGCYGLHLFLEVFSFAVLAIGLRPMDPISPATTGMAIAATASSWIALALGTRCASVELVHLLAAHVAPSPTLLVAGALVGQRYFCLRAFQRP